MNNSAKLTKLAYLGILLLTLVSSGCASSLMQPTPAGVEIPKPDSDHALVVFLRPSSLGAAVQAVVFDTTKETKVIGVVSQGTKIPYLVKPGKIELMVVSENGDFLKGDLSAGKTYYVVVHPRFGVFRARFGLKAISKDQLTKAETQKWITDGVWHSSLPEKLNPWVAQNNESIEEKRTYYHMKWDMKSESDRPTLHPEDGLM
ncbi:MAG: hypothetical protein QNL04_02795 [SAR324 cluster bacterium]|nr:hypothetical protein [SAR324 cluster bacterium]